LSIRGDFSLTVDDRLYFRQLLSGVDFAAENGTAAQMVNFVYLIGDRSVGKCVIVDPAYAVNELVDIALGDDMTVTDVLATHYHPDHVGGSMMGTKIEGISELLHRIDVPIHVQRAETEWVTRTTGVSVDHLRQHDSGDIVQVGSIEIAMVHTPGHTPGSQCFYIGNSLVAGDTLFLDGCGRTDLPGSDPEQMYESLQLLASMPDSTILYPGHRYSEPSSESLGVVKSTNHVFRPQTKQAWLQWFGR
jgi:glyoxylase-like metal-dependent hydrolase (beta-lactamase superfamily II)